MGTLPSAGRILTVSEITRRIKDTLQEALPALWVRGEVTGFKRAPSGHIYFSLKDGRAVLDCVLFSEEATRLGFTPRDGMEVEAYGNISVYEQRGRYQLYVEAMRLAGIGALLLALEELKKRLQAEGLFDAARKKPLPAYPRRIGLVTSPVGAAVRDIVTVLRGRWPSIEMVIAPVRVQGEGAAQDIAAAIEGFNLYGKVDLLIVGRGGGSLEDLWAFNEEIVVRAIAASRIPVISAVGHEVDFTLADSAADLRAATPSNAGELAVPERRSVLHRVEVLSGRLDRTVRHALSTRRQHLDHLMTKYAFKRPREVFQLWAQQVNERLIRLRLQLRRVLESARERLENARDAYGLREWPHRLGEHREKIAALSPRLSAALAGVFAAQWQEIASYEDRLRALSPRRVMERGYCLVRHSDGTLLRSAERLRIGDLLRVEFARDEADARVEAVRAGEDHGE